METTNCARCGMPFVKNAHNQRYCSAECSYQVMLNKYHYKRECTRENRTLKKVCPWCGNEFETTNVQKIYCGPECKRLKDIELAKEWKKNHPDVKYEPNKTQPKVHVNHDNTKVINNLNKEAIEHGMSYGKYVLYLKMQEEANERDRRRKRKD